MYEVQKSEKRRGNTDEGKFERDLRIHLFHVTLSLLLPLQK